ncbi:MAG: T9SS type A sorting domain-containing protein [Bacteroidota bacterium]
MRYVLLLMLFVPVFLASGQVVSSGGGSGDWNDPDSWSPAIVPTAASGTINILSGHTITVSDVQSADQITVDLGGVLTISGSGSFTVAAGSGDDLTINGTVNNNGILTITFDPPPPPISNATVQVNGILANNATINNASTSRLFFNDGSTYDHQYTTTAGTIPTATWSSNSTLLISGYTTNTSPPAGLNQTFGNVTWNTPSLAEFIDLNANLTTLNGDLRFISSPAYVSLTQSSALNILIGGDFEIGSEFIVTDAATVTLNIMGNMIWSNGLTFLGGSGEVTYNATDFTVSGGIHDVTYLSGLHVVNVSGDVNLSAGSLTRSGTGDLTINFINTSVQNFSSGTSIGLPVNYNIESGAIVDLGTHEFIGTGNFTLNKTAELRVGSSAVSGAIQSGITAGNIRVSGTRMFNTGSTVTYNGTGAQFIGSGHPSAPNTEINNVNSVSLASDVTIGGELTLTSGNLSVGDNQLTLLETITPNSNFIEVTTSSDLVIDGDGSFGTFPFNGPQTINNFTMDRPGQIVTFIEDITIGGTLTLNNGDLDFSNQTLVLDGPFTGGGFLFSNSTSSLNITESSVIGTLQFDPLGNNLGSFVINASSAVVTLSNTVNISSSLEINNGELVNSGAIFMIDGSTLTRNANGVFSGTSPEASGASTFDITYTGGALTTGAELPDLSDEVNDLTISGGPVTLNESLQVNGNVDLDNGPLAIGGNTLTILGNLIRTSGSLVTYSGFIEFAGSNSSVIGDPNFDNIRLTSGSSLTFPSSNINIGGTLQFISGSSFDSNNGTITLNGGADQAISAGGATFNNIVINKGGGQVTLSTALNLQGLLTFSTVTNLQAGDNLLTLLSTSDDGSGDAGIGVIPSGATVTGNITVQRFMNSGENPLWRYLASPVTNATVADWQDDFLISGTWSGASFISSDPSMYFYDETVLGDLNQGYVAYPDQSIGSSSDPLTPGVGYAAFVRSSSQEVIEVNGPINQGDFSTNISFTADQGLADDGWNLIGNPYPSSIAWDNIVTRTGTIPGVASTVYVADNGPGSLSYRSWDGTTGDPSFAGNIAQGQAFWVKAISASPTLTLLESDKTSSNGIFYRTKDEEQLIEIFVKGADNWDMTALRIVEGATLGYDPATDGLKLPNEKINLYTKSSGGENLIINTMESLDCSQDFDLYLTDVDEGAYTFEFKKIETFAGQYEIRLMDTFTGSSFLLTDGFVYSFEVTSEEESQGTDRFDISFTAASPDLDLSVLAEKTCAGNGSRILIQDSELGISYSALKGGVVVSDTLIGNGGDLFIQIDEDDLSASTNTFEIRAAAGCGDFQLESSVDIIKSEAVEISDLGNGLLSSSYESGNQWFFNDELIEGAVNQTYQVSESGIYSVEVRYESCVTRGQIEQVITSLDKIQNGVDIYPNPTKDILNFKLEAGDKRVVELRDLSGRVFKTETINAKNHVMDISDLYPGIYIIHIDMNSETLVYKIFKQ